MKALIILLAILAGVWLWRSGRDRNLGNQKRPRPVEPPGSSPTQPMVACSVCGVHVPSSEALIGHEGSYCCPAHRQRAEG